MFLFIIPDRNNSYRSICAAHPPQEDTLIAVPVPDNGIDLLFDFDRLMRDMPLPMYTIPEYEKTFDSVQNRTLIFDDRMRVIYDCCETAKHLDGMVAEVGVFKGGSLDFLSRVMPHKMVHGFDTFSGFWQKQHTKDRIDSGLQDLAPFGNLTFEDVIAPFGQRNNVRFHKGFFPKTAKWIREEDKFCMVHFDADLYEVTLDFLNTFYPKMVGGGKMVFDDYCFDYFPGVKQALDEFFADKPETPVRTHPIQGVVTIEER